MPFQISVYDKRSISPELLSSILDFSVKEFNEPAVLTRNPELDRLPSSLDHWRHLLSENKGRIYLAKECSSSFAGHCFTYEKSGDEFANCTHIWLAVTGSAFRRQGVMSALFDRIEAMEKEEKLQATSSSWTLTVNTLPELFPKMPLFVESKGFQLQSTTPIEAMGNSTSDGSSSSSMRSMSKYSYKKKII